MGDDRLIEGDTFLLQIFPGVSANAQISPVIH
jgi:hypothetical protein